MHEPIGPLDRDRLVDTFVRLARIDSPSRGEAAVAAVVRAELEALGFAVIDDGSGPSCGNLIARPAAAQRTGEPLLFASHLDVVEPCRGVQPRVADGQIHSDGTTVLGADAKASVAALVEAARVLRAAGPGHRGAWPELVFTWGEEVGHAGAKALDRARLQAHRGFVLDALLPTGSIVVAAPGYDALTVRVQGRAAHAGVEPERGVSAIAVAARAIDSLTWGRLDAVTTANIGVIHGGSARNAVPEVVELEGEIRSLDPARLAAQGRTIVDAFQTAGAAFGARVEIDLRHVYSGYELAAETPVVSLARRGWADLGRETRLVVTGGGSDANEFNAAGLECCVLGIGAAACHSVREHLPVDELVRLTEWVLAILAVAGDG
jgi:tripeptide aminopeptidase